MQKINNSKKNTKKDFPSERPCDYNSVARWNWNHSNEPDKENLENNLWHTLNYSK